MTRAAATDVTAIIAVKDGERFLGEAIESVISQSARPRQVIVVDGGSSDRSVEIAESFEAVRCIHQRGSGLPSGWNEALEEAECELIAFLDSDDIWLPGKLAAQVELLESRADLAGATGRARIVLAPGAEMPQGFRPEWLEGEHPAPMPGTLLVRREVFDRIGDFDTSYEIASDVDWFAKLKDAGLALETLPMLVLEKRFHSDNLSLTRREVYEHEMVRVLRGTVARQRARARE